MGNKQAQLLTWRDIEMVSSDLELAAMYEKVDAKVKQEIELDLRRRVDRYWQLQWRKLLRVDGT